MSLNVKTYIDPSDISGAIAGLSQSTNGITAFATGGQASATLLTTSVCRVTVVATAGDSVKLPVAVAGADLTLFNTSANSLNVFPSTGGIINALSANAAYALAAGKGAVFVCAVNGTWNTLLSA